ncbi:A24 family peptidase [soil metagenome]
MFEAPPDIAMLIYLFLLGACLGSFGNVVIYRMPLGKSVVRPGSACGSCHKPIKFRHNIPILSWFLLRGRCANCKAPYSVRYAMVELLTACLFACAWLRFGWSWTLIEALIFIFSLVVVSFIDLDHMILPDKFTLSGIIIGLVGAAVNPERPFMDSLYGVLLGGGFLWAIAYFYFLLRKREGMGGGDIKLLAWIGAVLGWQSVPFVILVASIFGSVVGVGTVLYKNHRSRKQAPDLAEEEDVPSFAIPFGPFLATAALVYLLIDGAQITQWYLDLHGL